MTEAFDSPGALTLKYLFGFTGTITTACLIIQILFNIELNQFKRSVAPEVEKNLSELSLSATASDDSGSNDESSHSVMKSSSNDSDNSYIRKKRIHKETKIGIFLNVAILTFVNYLLLVYLPSGVGASLIAMIVLSAILLRAQLIEDVRRKRFDRILQIFTLLIFMASFLSLSTYASIGKQEGGVYEGPARIVGYDVTSYDNQDQQALRTDLEVEWGGSWACPDTPDKQCHAYVSGALCEVNEGGDGGRKLEELYYEESDAEIKEAEEDFIEDETEVVVTTAEEDGLYYVEEIQDYEDGMQEEENDTENTVADVEEDVEIVEDNLADVGTDTAAGAEDVQTLEEKVEELEQEVQDLESENIVQQEVNEITEANAEYYAVAAQEETNSTSELTTENEVLTEDADYYAEVAEEVEEENDGLLDANEDLAEENEILEDEVEEAEESTTTEVITITYYPVNATNATGEYYETVTETEETSTSTTNGGDASDDEYNNNNSMNLYDDASDDGYSFEDDMFEDEYWGYDWSSAWGDYACNDLFDTDLEGTTYNEDEAPGKDEWPYVNIYGSCGSCKAFLVDFYSTEHFDKIKEYQRQAVTYASFGFVSVLVTAGFMVKQWLRPAEENQIDLLMSEGGQMV